ncbi:hypothetical protein LWI28_017310 [Acer negundo]|uniref:NB-ARC domain-containing protein n=1 Tax=Acer negundo TaxID=4023 RepID=A0AAD5J620_ACENE|nr:hypothetical protein LWI28_017310 [Acer negundo]
MEFLASLLGSAVGDTGQLVCASYPNIKNFMKFQKNRHALEKEMKSLLDLRNKVKEEVETSDDEMKLWLRGVEEIILDVNYLQPGKTTLVKNLNNKLESTSPECCFGIVMWVTVSKELDLIRIQKEIAKRLHLEVEDGVSMERLAIRLHQRLRHEKKFLLIFDDVRETIDLDCLGVPQPEIHSGSKIIVISRSLEVCRMMKIEFEAAVKVDVLNDEEAWQLFKQNSGMVATLEHIEPLAKAVAKECSGLPLAITIVGAAMRGKTMIELWKDALNELRRSVPFIGGIENKVYKPLKWSYDSLQGKNIKPCFLYCCLYPEDFSIEVSELVKSWVGEGLIDEQQNYEDSYNRGIALIANLIDSCLLEHGAHAGTVKMHDVVRDVAIWISSSLEDGCRSLVRSGIGLTQISEAEMFESLKRVSFMINKITGLPDLRSHCPEVLTLLLQGNALLERISDGFLQVFQSLRVLNIRGTHIQTLPESILQLVDLRVLLLGGCVFLEELPQLGALSKLQVLDCRSTLIRELPIE